MSWEPQALETLFRLRYYPVKTEVDYLLLLPKAVLRTMYLYVGGRQPEPTVRHQAEIIALAAKSDPAYRLEIVYQLGQALRQHVIFQDD